MQNKKKTRIISAAAALLAVSPIFATTVSTVLADSIVTIDAGTVTSTADAATLKLNVKNVADLVSGNVASKLQVALATPNVPAGAKIEAKDAKVYTNIDAEPNGKGIVGAGSEVQNFAAGFEYYAATTVDITGLTPGKTYEITAGDGVYNLEADNTGKITGIGVISDAFKLFDKSNSGTPIVKEKKEGGSTVTSGEIKLAATDTNVDAIAKLITDKYAVETNGNASADFKNIQDDIRASLTDAGINVKPNGSFAQPMKPFKVTLNLLADNGNTATFDTIVTPAFIVEGTASLKLNIDNLADLDDNAPATKLQTSVTSSTLPIGAKVEKSGIKVYTDVDVEPSGKGLVGSGTEVTNLAKGTDYYAATTLDITGLTPGKIYEITIGDGTYYLEADSAGKITGIGVVSDAFKLFDTTLTGEPVVKENKAGGEVVKSGSVDLTAADTNIAEIAAKITAKYAVSTNGTPTEKADFKDLQADIRAALSGVDANGNFTQPANPFDVILNLIADSGKTGTFKVTVNPAVVIPAPVNPGPVSGGGASTTTPVTGATDGSSKPAEDKVSKTVMHNAYIYDLQHKRVGTETLRAFTKVDVDSKPVKLEDGRLAYKIAEGQYVMADNIDGTSRVLKHNAYVYDTGKKRADKRVLRKGKTVITYGSPYKFKNGKLYYRIGGPAKQYVKVANIR
ncbi:SLAP domain-containing protein [Lactobacillus xylocopicola]|uniref:Surface layer protein n=1 Tax=Lactobacillus xylocopicola TaxID=2976676 RepID=A0ABN6SIW9_9LACO|nr:SLAP domain-containing protein [Lactobacillus xylocopicola]BDR60270.1 hypothetical protein KIM322_05310 [Lactobacillus xylocopicola]